MSDAVELKKNVKRLQAAINEKNEEVCMRQVPDEGTRRAHGIAVQDILSIMNIMKTEFVINEQILRVSPSRFSFEPYLTCIVLSYHHHLHIDLPSTANRPHVSHRI